MEKQICKSCESNKPLTSFFTYPESNELLAICKRCCFINGTVLSVKESDFLVDYVIARNKRKNRLKREAEKRRGVKRIRKPRYKYKPVNAEGIKQKCVICTKNKDQALFYNLTETSKSTCCKSCIGKKLEAVPQAELGIHLKRLAETKKRENKAKSLKRKQTGKIRANTLKTVKLRIGAEVPEGYSLHHWNYDFKYSWDVFLIKETEHQKAHLLMKREKGENFYRTLAGEALDKKGKHFDYLTQRGVILEHCKESQIRVSDKPWCRGEVVKMRKFKTRNWL